MSLINGTSGPDVLVGGPDPDEIAGNEGTDVIAGLAGDDALTGGTGYDLITPGAGNDSIDGGAGVDILALTGQLGDYLVEETTPGQYRITDQRVGAPEGSDTFTGIEKLRFEIGGEVVLADALDRTPTDVILSHTLLSGPGVVENAGRHAFVALLSGADPDPNEAFTFELLDSSGLASDAGGRFTIEGGDLLVVGRDNAFDFASNTSHSITIRVTDGAGNQFHKAVTIAVSDDSILSGTIAAVVPTGSAQVGLWELGDGGFVMTWRSTGNGENRWFARRVDDSGAPFDPLAPDRVLMELGFDNVGTGQKLLGVDDDGVAVFVQDFFGSPADNNTADQITWINALTGDQVRSKAITQSFTEADGRILTSMQAGGYFFDDGYVGYELKTEDNHYESTGGPPSSFARTESLTSQTTLFFEKSSAQGGGEIPGFSSRTEFRAQSFGALNSFEGPLTDSQHISETSGRIFDITEDGKIIYQERSSTLDVYSAFVGSVVIVGATLDVALKGNIETLHLGAGQTSDVNVVIADGLSQLHSVNNAAILDAGRFAYLSSLENGRKLVIVKNGGTVELEGYGEVVALGSDRYLAFAGAQAQVLDDAGNPLTGRIPVNGLVAPRDDGSFVVYTQQTSSDPQQPGVAVDGQSLALPGVSVEADGGVFQDNNGDGDLDFAGTILVGHETGEQSLRLAGGTYELTEAELKVTNATVFAAIGSNTTSPLFKGSFTLDRHTGIASSFDDGGELGAGVEPLKIAGLTVDYRGLTIQQDGAAFRASFQLPTLLFDGGPMLDLNSPNALLISARGPELAGFQVPIGTFDMDWFGLFEAEGKNLKVRYDGAQNELAFSGELKVTSDIVDGLASLAGGDDIALTFKGLKIKDGKIDFKGELSAEQWTLGPIKLKDVKLGIEIDDDVVISAEVAAGLELPFKQLTGLSFAGQVLNPPLSIDKLGLTAETSIQLPYGFFLDKIGGTLDHLAGSPPEPTPVPASFTGLLGIGWGPKVQAIELPEALGIGRIEKARVVNIELAVSTDWTTFIAGTGKINLYKDALAKHEGSITWDFDRGSLTFAGSIDYLSGIVTGTGSARFSELGFTVNGTGAIALPTASLFGPLSGLQLGSASFLARALDDDNQDNDVLAAWSTLNIPLVGGLSISQTVGVKVNLIDGDVSLILGANDVPETSSFDVLGTEDWLMISAVWDNPVAGPVLTQVRTPEGTFLQEAEYAANGITVIDLYTGPTKKTIVVDDPRAGNWDLQIIDPSGLTNVDYSGYTPNPAVEITVGNVGLVLGATTGQIDASLVGTDPGTEVIFYADTDDTGLDGFALGGTTRSADGAFAFDFGALTLAGGLYHVYAVADDGLNAPAADYGGTFTVAHRPTDITLESNAVPTLVGAGALIAESALPGAGIATIGAVNPDLTETHTFTLVDDAGGRFALIGDKLVVGTAAPFDATSFPSHQVVVRATTSRGLTFYETVTVEIGAADGARFVFSGTAERNVLLGTDRRDVFFGVSGDDTVIGLGEEDILYLDGNRADFEIVVDATGAITGPVRAFFIPDDIDSAALPPHPLDPAPPYVLLDDLRDSAGPIITSGIEILQFSDVRITLAEAFNTAPDAIADSIASTEGVASANLAAALLANDIDVDTGDVLRVSAVNTAVTVGTVVFDETLQIVTYTANATAHDALAEGVTAGDSFVYTVMDAAGATDSATATVTVTGVNDAPVLANALFDQNGTAGSAFSYTVAANSFADVDTDDTLTLSATLADDSALPSWLTFTTGSFSGTPGAGEVGGLSIKVTATDAHGLAVSDIFDLSVSSGSGSVINGTPGNDTLDGTAGNDTINGLAGNDVISGLDGEDTLDGGVDNDTLDGGAGDDTMNGGLGNDTYFIDSAADVINDTGGRDAVVTTLASYTLAPDLDFLAYTGSGNFTGTGNGLKNYLGGGAGDDTLDGMGGADSMAGGGGNDTYIVDNAGDVVVENAGAGTDLVRTALDSYGLTSEVENLVYTGSGNFTGTGNVLDNVLTGGTGNDTLDGGIGNDNLNGGLGNDTYFIDSAADVINDTGGRDAVVTTLASYTLAPDLDFLAYTGSGNFTGTGNALKNYVGGSAGNDTLDGGAGDDVLNGALGNDTYFIDSAGDVINDTGGRDAVVTTLASYTLAADLDFLAYVGSSNFTGTGNALKNYLGGGAGDDTLNGGAGADTLSGAAGNDIFVFTQGEAEGDVVLDFAGNGSAAGDSLLLNGFGAGATLTQVGSSDYWTINSGSPSQTIRLVGVTSLASGDYLFA